MITYYALFLLGIVFGCVFELIFNSIGCVYGEVFVSENAEAIDGRIRLTNEEFMKLPYKRKVVLKVYKASRTEIEALYGNDVTLEEDKEV